MDNVALKEEADQLILKCKLQELLAGYAGWFIGGSYSYDLMCWRDLDVYILDPAHDLKQCFDVGYEITIRLGAKKSRFTNNLGNPGNVGSEPNGLYWGIKLGDIRQGAWKLDVWFLDSVCYEQHAVYASEMRQKLTGATRTSILTIKRAYWQRPEFRDTVTSDLIYRAVFENGVRTVSDFERFLSENSQL
jgi:hypothetical protein